MKYILATTYDVFGYLIPGLIGALGLYLIAGWVAPLPDTDWRSFPAIGWTILLFLCYLVGHLIQAGFDCIFHWAPGLRGEAFVLNRPRYIGQDFFTCAAQKTSEICSTPALAQPGKPVSTPSPARGHRTWVWRFCETLVQTRGKPDTLDIYIYRQGFYRGLVGAGLILSLCAFSRLLGREDPVLNFGGTMVTLSRWMLVGLGAAGALTAFLSWFRYVSFSAYRVRFSLCSAVAPERPQAQ